MLDMAKRFPRYAIDWTAQAGQRLGRVRRAMVRPAGGDADGRDGACAACGWVTTSGSRNPLVTGAGIAYNSAEENTKRASAR